MIKKLGSRLAYILIGIVLAIAGGVAYSANVSIPQATQKGDLPTGKTNGNYQLLHPGADGLFLTASSTSLNGLDWETASSSGGSGITHLNGLVATTQTFATTVSGSVFNVTSSGSTHTFTFPSTPTFNSITLTNPLSVLNGGTGSTSLNTTLVPEGTNLYFTNARASAAISLSTTGTSGAPTYNQGTGALNIPIYQAQGSYLTTVSTTSPITGAGTVASPLGVTTGDLSLTSSNLSFGSGDGKKILLGTSTNITLTANPTFTNLTTTNASTSALTVSGVTTQTGQVNYGNASGTSQSLTNLYVTGLAVLPGLSNCNGTQFLQYTSPNFGCGTPAGGSGATTTINGIIGPTFTFSSANNNLTISTSSQTITLTVPTTTIQGLITGTLPISVTSGVVALATPLVAQYGGTGTTTVPSYPFGQLLLSDGTGAKYGPTLLVNTATQTWGTSTPGQLTANVLKVPNQVAFNNGGSGGGSGSVFDGSSALTVSYNTVGAQVAGTYVTSVSGSGSILSSGGTTPTIQLQNMTANDVLFGAGTNTFATSSNFTFNSATNLLTATNITSTNGTSTTFAVTGLTVGNCVQAGTGGLLQSASGACGSGGSGNSAWTIGSGLINNATSTDSVDIGTSTPTTATVFIVGSGSKDMLVVASSTGSYNNFNTPALKVKSDGTIYMGSLATSFTGCVQSSGSGILSNTNTACATAIPSNGTANQLLGNSTTNTPAWETATSTGYIYIDGQGANTNQNGSIIFPFRSISGALANATSSPAYRYDLVPNSTYVDGAPDTFPSAPFQIQGNEATYVPASGVTLPGSFDIYDLTIAGNVTESDNSLSYIHQFANGVITGNLTTAGLATISGEALSGTSSVYSMLPGSLNNFVGSISYGSVINGGISNINDANIITSLNNLNTHDYSFYSSTTGAYVDVNGLSMLNTTANGGGFYLQNGATSTPNVISAAQITVNSSTPGSTINCGTSACVVNSVNGLNNLSGTFIAPTGSNWIPVYDEDRAVLNAFSVGTSTMPIGGVATFIGNVGIGTTSPGYKLDISDSNNLGSVRITGASGGGFVLGAWNANTGGFWSNGLTPSTQNYALLANSAGSTYLNAATGQTIYLINSNGNNPGQLLVNQYGVSINNGLVGATSGNGLIVGSGNVGIGTTSPSQLFYVYGNLQAATGSTSTLLANTATQTVTVQNLVVNGTLNVTGQTSLANASTSNVSVSGTLYDKSNYKVVGGFTKTFWMASTTIANISGTSFGAATTTLSFMGFPYGVTMNRVACIVDTGGTVAVQFGNGVSSSTLISVGTSGASTTPAVTFNADQKVYGYIGSDASGADGLSCTIQFIPQ